MHKQKRSKLQYMDDLNYNCYDRPTTEAKFTKTDRTKWQLDGYNKVELYCIGGQEWALQSTVLYWLKQHQLKEELTFLISDYRLQNLMSDVNLVRKTTQRCLVNGNELPLLLHPGQCP